MAGVTVGAGGVCIAIELARGGVIGADDMDASTSAVAVLDAGEPRSPGAVVEVCALACVSVDACARAASRVSMRVFKDLIKLFVFVSSVSALNSLNCASVFSLLIVRT